MAEIDPEAPRILLVLRHGKSAWPENTPDLDRPLSKRGERSAARAGRFLAAADLRPDRVVSSPALRAMRTAQLAREAMVPRLLVGTEIEEALYEGSAEAIVSEAAEQLGCLLLVGHEPELLSLIVTRTGARVVLPTAGLAVIALDSWQGGGRLLALATPRLLEAAASAE